MEKPKNTSLLANQQRLADYLESVIIENYHQSGLSSGKFIKRHNAENPQAPITKAKLNRWEKKYKEGAKNDTE